jgi:hypothetical protein
LLINNQNKPRNIDEQTFLQMLLQSPQKLELNEIVTILSDFLLGAFDTVNLILL